ncbi:MAG: hypothetical protein M3Z66_11105, partial [Chloroflexota bacterium]|nr:hypothetical protein [Chloroflexota bacterium]
LLTVAAGGSFADAAREAGWKSGTSVAKLVARFNRQGLTALSIGCQFMPHTAPGVYGQPAP